MPSIVRANTNAAVIAIAKKAADKAFVIRTFMPRAFSIHRSSRSANVHNNNIVNVRDAVQLQVNAREMMLFNDQVVPVRASAREDTPENGLPGRTSLLVVRASGILDVVSR